VSANQRRTRRINHPSDVLRAGQVVQAQVLALDVEKRQIKLSMKQLVPTSIDEYIAEHKPGDTVSGRVVDSLAAQTSSSWAKVSVPLAGISSDAQDREAGGQRTGQGGFVQPVVDAEGPLERQYASSGEYAGTAGRGQIRSFKIVKLDAEGKKSKWSWLRARYK